MIEIIKRTPQDLTVLLGDKTEAQLIPDRWPKGTRVKVYGHQQVERANRGRHIFVLASGPTIERVVPFVSAMNHENRLKGLLVNAGEARKVTDTILRRTHLRLQQRLFLHDGAPAPARVLMAWAYGAPHDAIADAVVVGDRIIIRTCAFDDLEIGFDAYPTLRRIPVEARSTFTIDEEGDFLYWLDPDVHLTMEDIRIANDPELNRRLQMRGEKEVEARGRAVREMRELRGLTQSAIPSLSARQLRRIENGTAYLTMDALEKIARGHQMDPDDYLNQLIAIARKHAQ